MSSGGRNSRWTIEYRRETISTVSFDNAEVFHRPFHPVAGFAIVATLLSAGSLAAQTPLVAAALDAALRGTQASGVVLDTHSGNLLASVGTEQTGTPGSVIKPLLLAYALDHGIVRPETQVYCRRNLRVGDRALPCTHPADQTVFTAETALAESCNTWFAEMARRFTGQQLEAALRASYLTHTPMDDATVEQRQLAVLGLGGVTTSTMHLAQSYRLLLRNLPPAGPVALGLRDSVAYGMANPAAVPGVEILGKTGTASNPGEAWTHGWFAGALPGRFIVAIYVPHGDGGTAARLAQKFFAAMTTTGGGH
jgi:membrane peptidoglycan carboxypeptidase